MRKRTREALSGYLFLTPNLIGFLIFTSLPVAASLLLAFSSWDILSSPQFVGLQNFSKLLLFHREAGRLVANDFDFWYFTANTLFLMLIVPVGMVASMGLAIALNSKIRGIVAFRTAYFLPTLSAGVAVYVLWTWIYNGPFGLFNAGLRLVGVEGPNWLSDKSWAKPALMLMSLWIGVGGVNMLLYLAGLQGIDPELYEAAEIDGAGGWHKFRHITYPMLSPTTFFILVMSVIGGLQGGFEQANIMTLGGPAGATTTLGYYIYQLGFVWYHMGYAATVAWMMFAGILVVTAINWRWGGRRVHY